MLIPHIINWFTSFETDFNCLDYSISLADSMWKNKTQPCNILEGTGC